MDTLDWAESMASLVHEGRLLSASDVGLLVYAHAGLACLPSEAAGVILLPCSVCSQKLTPALSVKHANRLHNCRDGEPGQKLAVLTGSYG